MYIRVKRQKQTIFLSTDPNETVADVKKKLADINKISQGKIRLLTGETVMEDSKTIGDLKIENEKIIFMVYKKEGIIVYFLFINSLIIYHQSLHIFYFYNV